jgi:hypothetical protein
MSPWKPTDGKDSVASLQGLRGLVLSMSRRASSAEIRAMAWLSRIDAEHHIGAGDVISPSSLAWARRAWPI